jgi:hypothetical protein
VMLNGRKFKKFSAFGRLIGNKLYYGDTRINMIKL